MDIKAVERGPLAHWGSGGTGPGPILMGVWSEKRPGRGEDAEPLVLHHADGFGLLAVFDGVGGAGSAGAGRSWRGHDRTGAWVGSRVARAATEEWFVTTAGKDTRPDPEGLRAGLTARLTEARPSTRRKIVGSMRRELPTTIASATYRVGVDGLAWTALWAGDSRCFVLEPEVGLAQLTRDDTEPTDALALLIDDPPMTNYACADRSFRVNAVADTTAVPAVLLCATDGFFGYLDTPAGFEHVLLSTLAEAEDVHGWGERLADCVAGYTADDASLALAAFGWPDFAALRAAFAERSRFVQAEFWDPVRAAAHDRASFVDHRARSWERYRKTYERYLHARPMEDVR